MVLMATIGQQCGLDALVHKMLRRGALRFVILIPLVAASAAEVGVFVGK
jgi:hypothetical protein